METVTNEKIEAIRELRKLLKPGARVFTILRHVSRSGMQRRIDVYTIRKNAPVWITGYVGKALGYRHHRQGGLVVDGCGMDMGYHLVNSLSYALHGMKDKGDAVSAGERGIPFGKPRPGHYRAGYSLRHDWL